MRKRENVIEIRRDKRNIGKLVMHDGSPDSPLYGQIGKIVGFRGDNAPGDPFVTVYFASAGASYPVAASKLRRA